MRSADRAPDDRHRLRAGVWPLLVLAVLVFFWRAATFAGALFHFDLIGFAAPIRAFFFGHLARGEFPLWCSDLCAGFPLFLEGQVGPLYPPNLLFAVLPPWAALNFSVVLHALIAILGAYAYLRRSHDPGPAAVGAVSYAFSSFLVFHIVHLMIFQTACLLPWLFFFFDRFLARGRAADVLLSGAWLGLMLLPGQQQAAFLGALGLLVFALAVAAETWTTGRRRPAAAVLAGGAGAAVLASLAAGFVLIGVYVLVGQSVRQEALAASDVFTQSLVPRLWVRLASPAHHGREMDATFWLAGHSEREVAVYLGLAAFVLAPFALARGGRWRDRAHLAVLAFGFLFILGAAGPFAGLWERLPVVSRMRVPARFLLPMTLSLSYLVASGTARLREGPWSIRRTALALTLGAAAWAELAWGGALVTYGPAVLPLASAPAPDVEPLRGALAPLRADLLARSGLVAALVAASLGLRVLARRRTAVLALAGIGACIYADLALAGLDENPVADPRIYGPFATTEFLAAHRNGARIYSTDNHLPYAHGGWARGTESFRHGIEGLPHQTPLLFSLPTATCGLPFTLARTQAVYDRLTVTWLRQMGVGYVLSRKPQDLPAAFSTDRVTIYEIPAPAPRYSIAARIVPVASPAEAMARAGEPRADLAETAFVEGIEAPPEIAPGVRGTVAIAHETQDRRVLSVRAPGGGFLVVRESWFPGWRAWVDGAEVPIYRANYLFFGLFVPPGDHEVVLRFLPRWLVPLLVLSAITFGGAFLLALRSSRLRRERGSLAWEPTDPATARRILTGLALGFLILLAVAMVRHPEFWGS